MNDLSPDVNKIATELLKDVASSFWDKAKSLTSDQLGKLKLALKLGLDRYVNDTIERTSRVKTILYRDRAVHLSSMYVDTTFFHQGKEITESEFFLKTNGSKKSIVAGNAGCGKSIFMKHAALHYAKEGNKRIPIFVELRHINHFSTSILHYVHEQLLKPMLPNFELSALDFALKSGLFVLVLDGFDEVDHDRREKYLQEINHLSTRYRELTIILSTRPEEATLALDGFSVFHVAPLSKESSIDLVDQLEFDTDVKEKFKQAISLTLYESHHEFASNPLLLTMLLLTFDQVGDLPHKMHIFYNQAFEILVFKHDRLKALYTRKTYSSFDIEQIRNSFSFFCAVSYFESEISFTEGRFNSLLAEAIAFYELPLDADNLKLDLIHSFSMLKRDGLFVTFVHRTFQEYFCAYFLARTEAVDVGAIIEKLADRGKSEQCLKLLYDMAPERFVEHWLKGVLAQTIDTLEFCESNISRFVGEFHLGAKVSNLHLYLIGKTRQGAKLDIILELIGSSITPDEKFYLLDKQTGSFHLSPSNVEAFFGGNDPFSGCVVELRPEDNRWLSGSELPDYVRQLANILRRVLHQLDDASRSRKSRAGLFSKKVVLESPRVQTRNFPARGSPQIIQDPKTGNERIVPRTIEIARNVLPDQ